MKKTDASKPAKRLRMAEREEELRRRTREECRRLARRPVVARQFRAPAVRAQRCLGTRFTEEDERLAQHCCRQAVAFMQRYGQPRTPEGESMAPPPGWLFPDFAALYCDCTPELIKEAGDLGMLPKIVVCKTETRTYYAYSTERLDALLRGESQNNNSNTR